MKKADKVKTGIVFGSVILLSFFWSQVYDFNIESWRTGGGSTAPEVFPSQVQHLGWSTEPPDQQVTFWCIANRTVDAYIMTDEQCQEAESGGIKPVNYIHHYTGQRINTTFITSIDGGVRYNFVIYTESSPVLTYSYGMIVTHQVLNRQLNTFYLVLGLLTASALLFVAISPYKIRASEDYTA